MKVKDIIYRLSVIAGVALTVSPLCACSDDDNDGSTVNPYFMVDGVEGRIIMDASGTGMESFTSGKEYDVKACGEWTLVPEGGVESDWVKVYPLHGTDEGVIRIYASANDLTSRRVASYDLVINGVKQPSPLIVDQDPAPANFRLSSDNIRINTSGGNAVFTVDSNVEWTLDFDDNVGWLRVVRDGNAVTVTAPDANDSGHKRSATIYVRGLEPYEDVVLPVTVTQLYAIYSEDFSWIPNTQSPALCWVSPSNESRVDQWPKKFTDSVEDPSVLTAWSGVMTNDGKVLAYSSYNYIKLGSSTRSGNICSPAIESIDGSINVLVSWSMAGFCKKTNERVDGNMFYAAILGPGHIVQADAHGKSSAWIETGFSIPYSSTGDGHEKDVELTEIAGFEIGPDGYFDTNDKTGLLVWNSPESRFSMKVEGMTSDTRIVFIAGEAGNVTMLNDWLNTNGTCADSRKLFDNFMIEEE